MATIERCGSKTYSATFGMADIRNIANEIKTVPEHYINARGNGVTEEFMEYLKPLIIGEHDVKFENGLPLHVVIE